MSRRTRVRCHGDGQIGDTSGGRSVASGGKKCEALRMWRRHKRALRKDDLTPELLVHKQTTHQEVDGSRRPNAELLLIS